MRMLELFSGTATVSDAFKAAGWETLAVDANPALRPDVVADIAKWSPPDRRFDLVWASPPCTEYSLANPRRRAGAVPSPVLWAAAERIVVEIRPRYWIIENVRGACKWKGPARWCAPSRRAQRLDGGAESAGLPARAPSRRAQRLDGGAESAPQPRQGALW